jgi:hypothetical protein
VGRAAAECIQHNYGPIHLGPLGERKRKTKLQKEKKKNKKEKTETEYGI